MAILGVYQKTLVLALAAGLALAGCAKKEIPLKGQRLDLRGEISKEANGAEAQKAVAAVTPVKLPVAQNYAQWTHKNGSTAHKVSNPALGMALTRIWAQKIGTGNGKKTHLSSDPIIAQGRIYTLDAGGQVRAFGLETGAPQWSSDLSPAWDKGKSVSGGGLAYGNGVLVATTGFGEVVAIDPASGSVRWRQRTNAGISGAPVVINGEAIAVTLDNKAIALDLTYGRIRWQIQSGGSVTGLIGTGAPAALGDFVALPFASGELIGANTATGARIWSAAVSAGRKGLARGIVGAISGDPVISGNTVYAANQVGRLISIDMKTGTRNWTVNDGSYSPVWVAGGSVFIVTDGFKLKRLNGATGAEIWSVKLPGYLKQGKRQKTAYVHYGPVMAGNRLIVASSDGNIRSFNPSSGAALGVVKIQGGAASQPAIVNGTLYILSGNGQLQAFK
ncbi:MAG: PQQ-binding-like beta-propeller repeat protein [Rhodobacterales bacterium]